MSNLAAFLKSLAITAIVFITFVVFPDTSTMLGLVWALVVILWGLTIIHIRL